MQQDLLLYESGRTKPVGTLEVIVRLTSHGNLLVTQFARDANSNNYEFTGLNQYVSTNAKVSKSCLNNTQCPKKCCNRRKIKQPTKTGIGNHFTMFVI